jgi:hypothetical protein
VEFTGGRHDEEREKEKWLWLVVDGCLVDWNGLMQSCMYRRTRAV